MAAAPRFELRSGWSPVGFPFLDVKVGSYRTFHSHSSLARIWFCTIYTWLMLQIQVTGCNMLVLFNTFCRYLSLSSVQPCWNAVATAFTTSLFHQLHQNSPKSFWLLLRGDSLADLIWSVLIWSGDVVSPALLDFFPSIEFVFSFSFWISTGQDSQTCWTFLESSKQLLLKLSD